MIICVTGDTDDLSAVYVAWAARRAGHDVLVIDEEAGVFARFHPDPRLPCALELEPPAADAFRVERRAALHQLLRRIPCAVANRPCAGRSNGSKPLQMRMLEAAGFRVPDWIVANDAERVRA